MRSSVDAREQNFPSNREYLSCQRSKVDVFVIMWHLCVTRHLSNNGNTAQIITCHFISCFKSGRKVFVSYAPINDKDSQIQYLKDDLGARLLHACTSIQQTEYCYIGQSDRICVRGRLCLLPTQCVWSHTRAHRHTQGLQAVGLNNVCSVNNLKAGWPFLRTFSFFSSI